MRLTGKRNASTRAIALLSLLFLFAPAAVSPASARTGTAAQPASLPRVEQFRARNAELQTVLSVIEHRTRDGKVLEKMQKKLFTLGDRQLRLAASLCERITRNDQSTGASIAFSIVTAMIVLS
ncbi:MAG: hypothetical protein ACYC7L_10520 [Nitrospirota bacterium]